MEGGRRRLRVTQLIFLLGLIVIIGWMDYKTGPQLGLSLFYLVPIVLAGWFGEAEEAIACGVLAAVCWYLAEIALAEPLWITTWNGITRLTIFLALGILTARVHDDRRRLGELNERITASLNNERTLARMDVLTELPNSRFFYEKLEQVLAVSRTTSEPVSIGILDLDNFKRVNDLFGHAAGDDLLKRIGRELRAAVRTDDFAARMGGDEFAIIFRECDPDAAREVGQRIIDRVSIIGEDYPSADLGASIGIAIFEEPPANAEEAIRQADAAMYEGKAAGKRRVTVRRESRS